jgi:uncharacterized repeat protein (TIGR02543 family)
LTVVSQHVGDLLILSSQIHSQAITVSTVASTGTGTTGTWNLAQRYVDTTNGVITEEIWWAVVTGTGSTTITATYSGDVSALTPELVVDSFVPATATSWSVVASNGAAGTANSTITFPSLTSGTSANQLYWGYTESTGIAAAGSTSGFTYTPTTDSMGNLTTYNAGLAPSTNYTPTASQGADNYTANAVIFADSAATPATNTVAFTSDGGSVASSISGPNGSTITLPTPTFVGYTFNGWWTLASGGSLQPQTYPLAGSTTLFAHWTANTGETVTYNGNTSTGGTVPTDATSYTTGDTVTVLANSGTLVKAGYAFNGWNTQAGGGGTSYAATGSVTFTISASTNLYAQWTPNTGETVTYNGNTSTGGTVPTDATSYTSGNTVTVLANTGTLVKAGYAFNDWNTQALGGGTSYAASGAATFTIIASTTLYAQWTPIGGGGGGGGGGGTPALGTLTISAATLTVTVGGTVAPTASVTSGLTSPDTGTVTSVTFTYAGTGSTVYAASTTAPATAGTYSVTPSAATVTISPSADAANYSTTYTYVGSVLDINNPVVVPVTVPVVVSGPHATRVIGYAIVGKSRTLTIVGRDFTVNPGVTSNQSGAVVRVHSKSANRIVLSITVRKGIRPGTHLFTITASGKKCKIGYVTR